ncbi:MAG: RnfABCDGE type electron transport complex subunit B [Candidatus Omnitrophica bacterium]|nr:RnfABCDGE type electron transport complex subunit B [Candidatus Omnitrophota bacterium]MDD5238462.1 RnfABCDGE type electron transport complex subunit B [Candidatus Omnitrophota bacterium]
MDILIPILTLGSLGLLFGIGLAIASKKLAVQVDPRLERIHGLLPGSNCGACGGAGCFGFAESVLSGKLSIDACRISSEETKEKIAKMLGQRIEKKVKLVATLHCYGGKKVKDKYIYQGIKTCVAVNMLAGGLKTCTFGCIGFGDCVRICPFNAISMSDEGFPVVDEKKCKACNKCVMICPKKLFSLVPVTGRVYVACRSQDTGKYTRLACPVGCIACRKCEQICPVEAIKVIDNVAVIDYKKCTSCGKCVDVCPTKTIRKK